MLASYRAVPGPLISDEWVQLEALTGHGQPLAAGFSGAAVTLADGTVVGMVSAVAGARDVRVGRMLPVEVMARYWPELGELVPTPGHRSDARRRLYALVRRAEETGLVCDPNRLYVSAMDDFAPPPPEGGFASLREAAAYVQWEVPEPDAVARFADRLEERLEGSRPASPRPARWSPIVVEIDHSGAGADQVTVEVSAYRDGRRRPVGSRRMARGAVRSFVQERIDEAFTHLDPGAEELITFVLPRVAQRTGRALGVQRGRSHPARLRLPAGRHRPPPPPQRAAAPPVAQEVAQARRQHRRDPPPRRLRDAGAAGRVAQATARRRGAGRVRRRAPEAREHFEVGLNLPVRSCCGRAWAAPATGTTAPARAPRSSTGSRSPWRGCRRRTSPPRHGAARDRGRGGRAGRALGAGRPAAVGRPRCFAEPAAPLNSPVG